MNLPTSRINQLKQPVTTGWESALRRLTVVGAAGAAALSLFLAGCQPPDATTDGAGPEAPRSGTSSATPNPASNSVITANPNPVPFGPGDGSTEISWDLGEPGDAQVYLSINGAPETLFAQNVKGKSVAPWIGNGGTYEFRLYAGTEHKDLRASVKVNRLPE